MGGINNRFTGKKAGQDLVAWLVASRRLIHVYPVESCRDPPLLDPDSAEGKLIIDPFSEQGMMAAYKGLNPDRPHVVCVRLLYWHVGLQPSKHKTFV